MQSARHVSFFADMPVKVEYNIEGLKAEITDAVMREIPDVVKVLQYVGEMCVNEARTKGNYMDRTGNLRSSTGYIIVVGGEIVDDGGFQVIQGTHTSKSGDVSTFSGDEGAKKGREYAETLAATIEENQIALIVVAGMEYAKYVESKENYEVLSSAELLAKNVIPGMLNRLFNENGNTGTE